MALSDGKGPPTPVDFPMGHRPVDNCPCFACVTYRLVMWVDSKKGR